MLVQSKDEGREKLGRLESFDDADVLHRLEILKDEAVPDQAEKDYAKPMSRCSRWQNIQTNEAAATRS